MIHISHVTALFKNDKETAEKYIRKLQDELLITTDSGKQYFSSFCVAIYLKMNSITHPVVFNQMCLFTGLFIRLVWWKCNNWPINSTIDLRSCKLFSFFYIFCLRRRIYPTLLLCAENVPWRGTENTTFSSSTAKPQRWRSLSLGTVASDHIESVK